MPCRRYSEMVISQVMAGTGISLTPFDHGDECGAPRTCALERDQGKWCYNSGPGFLQADITGQLNPPSMSCRFPRGPVVLIRRSGEARGGLGARSKLVRAECF